MITTEPFVSYDELIMMKLKESERFKKSFNEITWEGIDPNEHTEEDLHGVGVVRVKPDCHYYVGSEFHKDQFFMIVYTSQSNNPYKDVYFLSLSGGDIEPEYYHYEFKTLVARQGMIDSISEYPEGIDDDFFREWSGLRMRN